MSDKRSPESSHRKEPSQTKLPSKTDREERLKSLVDGPQDQPTAVPLLTIAKIKGEGLSTSDLESWLWEAACSIRGAADAPKFKDFILPLVFYKRLSDVYDDEFAHYVTTYGNEQLALEIVEADHKDALKHNRTPIIRFFVPSEHHWKAFHNHPADGLLGEFVTDAMRKVALLNPDLRGVLDVKDYNERQSGQRLLDDDRLAELIQVLSQHRLGLDDTEPDVLGRAYEYLLRKFAEPGQSAGEFYTPKEVGLLIAHLIGPRAYETVYDPACGSAGLLIKVRLLFEQQNPAEKSSAPRLFGQELNPTTFAIAKMNMFLHDFTDSRFAIGDTLRNPKFAKENELNHFDCVVANPMWNQGNYDSDFYENDFFNRFLDGVPPKTSADWGWVQHILASLNQKGRAAIVLDTGAVSRGSGSKSSNRERKIRKALVKNDVIECVILLPENLFYNTSAPGIILTLNLNKRVERKGLILLINASTCFVKGMPKNELTDDGITSVSKVYHAWEECEKFSKIISLEEARESDYNLSPSQFVDISAKIHHRPFSEITADLVRVRTLREKADDDLNDVLKILGQNLDT